MSDPITDSPAFRLQQALKEAFEAGVEYRSATKVLNLEWSDYKRRHPPPDRAERGVHVRIVQVPDGQLGHAELITIQKSIDIPFEELSPRAKRLYMDAVKEIVEKQEKEVPSGL